MGSSHPTTQPSSLPLPLLLRWLPRPSRSLLGCSFACGDLRARFRSTASTAEPSQPPARVLQACWDAGRPLPQCPHLPAPPLRDQPRAQSRLRWSNMHMRSQRRHQGATPPSTPGPQIPPIEQCLPLTSAQPAHCVGEPVILISVILAWILIDDAQILVPVRPVHLIDPVGEQRHSWGNGN